MIMSSDTHDQNQDINAIRAELQDIRALLEEVKQGLHCPFRDNFAQHSMTQEEIMERLNPNWRQHMPR